MEIKIREFFGRTFLLVLIASVFCGNAGGQERLCDLGGYVLEPGGYKLKGSLVHTWRGAWGGINTKNADRIAGLYDLDFYYLLAAEEDAEHKGDYVLLGLSSRANFGSGVGPGKVGSFFNLNKVAKGDLDLYLDKAFVRFTLADRKFTFDVGKIDVKDNFDGSAVASKYRTQFIAKPFANNAAIPFPSKGLGISGQWEISRAWYFRAGIVDAQSNQRTTGFDTTFHDEDYYFGLAEVGLRTDLLGRAGTYRLTTWYDPKDKSYLDGSGQSKRDDLGWGLSFDQKITDKTTLFFRYGWADDKVNEVEDFFSFGGDIKGPFEGRKDDVFGIAYGLGLRSEKGLDGTAERRIDMAETYYRFKLSDNLSVSPHLQLVMEPGGLKSESPAMVFGVRCRYTF